MKGKRGKMGSPHSSLMGYGEIKASKKTIQLGCDGTTYLVGPAGGDEGVVAARKNRKYQDDMSKLDWECRLTRC